MPLSGYPEWSPRDRVIERDLLGSLHETFRLHGFTEIETRAVEPLERLVGDSETSKEIYGISRVADPGEEMRAGLHFDLTVPFARYVEEFQSELVFPFRRYQIQKVWRGERPQEGRFREFYQADIDVVGRDSLPIHVDADVASVMLEALAALPISPVRMHINNRRVVEGFYRGVGVADVPQALRSVDKLPKIGTDAVRDELVSHGLDESISATILELAKIRSDGGEFVSAVEDLWESSRHVSDVELHQETLARGLLELRETWESINSRHPHMVTVDLSIARGLDYYTGNVFETFVEGDDRLGSVCSGGRYESLITGGGFPGVGLSIGVSRLVSRLVSSGRVSVTRAVPTVVVVAVIHEDSRADSQRVANILRGRGIATEVAPVAAKFGKQIQYADKRDIPYVWFPGAAGSADEVKDIRSGHQSEADVSTWEPPAEDARPRVERD